MKHFTLILYFLLFGITSFAQNTYVPDDNFEQFLIDEGYDTGPLDDYVPTANIETIEILYCHGQNIHDLTGIGDFTALKELNCRSNAITDFSPLAANIALEDLDCRYNYPGTLDLTSNVNLIDIDVRDCNLTAMNVDGLANLEVIRASNNNLSQIDLSSNSALRWLYLNENTFSELDVSNNFMLDILSISSNLFTSIDVSNNSSLGILRVDNNTISELDLSQNVELLSFSCRYNNFTGLNFENNVTLKNILCGNNQISELILPPNPIFNNLRCPNNLLTELDLSMYPMQIIVCDDNPLEFLDMRNGNNENVTQYNTSNTPNLSCIYVDDIAYSQSNWDMVDPNTTFVETEAECAALSIDEVALSDIEVYPNPVYDQLSLRLYGAGSYKINNLQGQNILNGKLISGTNTIDFSYLESGVYVMTIESMGQKRMKKVIKN